MRSVEDITAYLTRAAHPHREIAENTWLIGDSSGVHENIIVRVAGDLVIFRMKVLDLSVVDKASEGAFYKLLLELNATELLHGAYCITDGALLLTSTLLLENLDYNEFVAVIEDFVLAMTNQHERLAAFAGKA